MSERKDWEKTADELEISPFVIAAAVLTHGEQRVREVVMEAARRYQQGNVHSPGNWLKRALAEHWSFKKPRMQVAPTLQTPRTRPDARLADYLTRDAFRRI